MRDPERRLSASSDADTLEREVLASLRDAKAPADAKAAVWQGIAAGIGAGAAPASAAASAAGAKVTTGAGVKLTLGMTAKVALATAAMAAAVGGAYVLAPQHGPERAKVQQAPSAVMPPAAVAPGVPVPAPAALAILEPEPAVPAPTLRAGRGKAAGELLAEESALLSAARADLRTGDASSAAAKLRKLQERFPKGALLQERKVLDIDVLLARGKRDAALRSARAFVQRYPNSPHSTQLRALLGDP